jgi:hypothetical protein
MASKSKAKQASYRDVRETYLCRWTVGYAAYKLADFKHLIHFGPKHWICPWCLDMTWRGKSECDCVPAFVTYCWKCYSHDCGHQRELVEKWQSGTFYTKPPAAGNPWSSFA